EMIVDAPNQVAPILADQDRLKQVLTNLVSNAVKFTAKGSILIRLQQLDRGDCVTMWANIYCPDGDTDDWRSFTIGVNRRCRLLVSVTDTGVGIPAWQLPVVFERFGQVGDHMTNKPIGTGLGLAICLDIARRLHGYLWVESEMGQGSRFTLALPAD